MIPVVMLAGWEWGGLAAIKTRGGKSIFLVFLLFSLGAAAIWLNLLQDVDMLRGQQFALVASILWAIIFLWVQGYPSSAILWSSKLVAYSWVVSIGRHLGGHFTDCVSTPWAVAVSDGNSHSRTG